MPKTTKSGPKPVYLRNGSQIIDFLKSIILMRFTASRLYHANPHAISCRTVKFHLISSDCIRVWGKTMFYARSARLCPLAASSRTGFCQVGNMRGSAREPTPADILTLNAWGWPKCGPTFSFFHGNQEKQVKSINGDERSTNKFQLDFSTYDDKCEC